MALIPSKKLAIIVLFTGLISLVMGGLFIAQSVVKGNMIKEAMALEKVVYEGEEANGSIHGVIDTPQEAQVMAGILRGHRLERYGRYTELARDDPKRQTILSAMTMENSLNLAQLSYGLTEVVKATGIFMIITGLALGASGFTAVRSGRKVLTSA